MKRISRLLSLLLVAVMVFGLMTVDVAAASYSTGPYTVSHASGVNVRSSASTSGRILGASAKNTSFTVTKVSKNWGYTTSIKTTKGTKAGWVCLDYFKASPNKKEAAVHDLKIDAASSVSLKANNTTRLTVQFSGVGIDQAGITSSGKGFTARVTGYKWKAYPEKCLATIEITTSASFRGDGSITFQLKNNKYGVVKEQKISLKKIEKTPVKVKIPVKETVPAKTGSNIGESALKLAAKNIGKTRSDLGYSGDWCAYYVSDCLKGANLNIGKQSTPRKVVQKILENNQGTYYSFRHGNIVSLKNKHNLKSSAFAHIKETTRPAVIPKPGDIVIFLWSKDKKEGYNWSHVGFVESYNPKTGVIKTVEGNTGSYPGVVARKNRSYDSTVVGILRID